MKQVRAAGSQATPEVIGTWVEVYRLYQELEGERRERLQQIAERLGVSFKVARRRLRNYEAMVKAGNEGAVPQAAPAPAVERVPGREAAQPPPRRERSEEMSDAGIEDRQLTCVDCGQDFTWSAGEQAFFREKGFTDPPKRCKPCRQARKDRRGDSERQGGGRG